MKNKIKKELMLLLLVSFFANLLLFSRQSMELASKGLLIWYQNMIPSLFPFMVFSGYLVKSGLAGRFSRLLKPFLGCFFPSDGSMLYALFMGFFCGFPMGAKVVADLLESRQINEKQGEYLLAFCNNIGPLYLLGYVIPLFGWNHISTVFLLFYGVPLAYGFCLQFSGSYKKELKERAIPREEYAPSFPGPMEVHGSYLFSFQISLEKAIEQMTLLGGCMVFFNCLQIYPRLLGLCMSAGPFRDIYVQYLYGPLCCLLEIGGGLQTLSLSDSSLMALCYLTFGGLSCIMQTGFILRKTQLRLSTYLKHKLLQATILALLLLLLGLL